MRNCGHPADELLGFANFFPEFLKGYADKVYTRQQLMRNKGKNPNGMKKLRKLLRT